jgi:hypothetical protein
MRRLNRALLARQLLLDRSRMPIGRALQQVAGLQAQYAPSPYIRLWSMLEGFELQQLTRALERRRAVQGTLMRSTIHIVSPRDYWRFAAGLGPSREAWWLGTHGREYRATDLRTAAHELRRALSGRSWRRTELDALIRDSGSASWKGAWVELIRQPPSGTWERRRADLYRLASEWLPYEAVAETDGLEHLLRRYLGAFGPARLADAADWAGVERARLISVLERIRTRIVHDADGRELLDLPRAPLPPEETPAPARFLGTWDAALLVHARRAQILPERFRPLVFHTKNPQSLPTFLVDGAVAGSWRIERTATKATLRLEPFEPLARRVIREVREEGERLVRFHEPDATTFAVR